MGVDRTSRTAQLLLSSAQASSSKLIGRQVLHPNAASLSLPSSACARGGVLRVSSVAGPSLSTSKRLITTSVSALQPSSSKNSSSAHPSSEPSAGPTARYNELVERGLLRDDSHQRSIIALLQASYEELSLYDPPPPTKPIGHQRKAATGFVSLVKWKSGSRIEAHPF